MRVFLLLVCIIVAVAAKPASIGLRPSAFRPAANRPRSSAIRPVAINPSPRITNGQDAVAGEFKYQVSYQWGIFGFTEHVCGGSIISPTWVITAGHCVTQVPTIGDFKIIAGIVNLLESGSQRQEINVVERIVHSSYGGSVGPNDIALLRLASPLTWTDSVQPISLPAANVDPSGDAVLSGWGSTSTTNNPTLPNHLQKLRIPILPNIQCNSAIVDLLEPGEGNPFSLASNICTGPLTGGISACSGDSGGPLAQDGVLEGVVSWGWTPCGSPGAPSVYTKVANFLDFIKQHVTNLP